MDYYEFKEKSGWDISIGDYEQIVEPCYLKGPADVVGVEVTLFCNWLKDNDFTLNQLKAIMPLITYYDDLITRSQALRSDISKLETDLMLSRTNEENAERRIRAILRCYGEDDVCQRMVDDIPTDQIIDMYARSKGIE